MMLEEQVQREIETAKLEGLAATRQVIRKWNHNKEYQWDIMEVSPVTANKLLQGEFKTFDELEISKDEDMGFYSNLVNVLYREVSNPNRNNFLNYIIETIFIDE